MTPDEVQTIVKVASSLGVTQVKLTGGEPLLRKDIYEILQKIKEIKEIRDISLTTNGTLLSDKATKLKEAGLNRINISLDSLNPEKYKLITGHNNLNDVLKGIDAAIEAGLNPIKINMVLLKGINEDEVWDMIGWSKRKRVILQLIELVPLARLYRKLHVSLDKIEAELEKIADRIVERKLHNRRKYFLGETGEVELVKPVHNTSFCANCNRIRVTSNGYLKPCLMRNDNLVDIITPIRAGASFEELKKIYIKAIMLREPFYR